MADLLLEVNNISKYFKLYRDRNTLLNTLKQRFFHKPIQQDFWALRDINFSLNKGEAIAVIGNNGSGKTTLLRIISGIYKQTEGDVRGCGKINGFFNSGLIMHRDLNGLDNIFLIGSMIGIFRKEINKKLKSIIDFSELGDFIYTPVRNYSTGMLEKLAISVIRELNSDVIYFDELFVSSDANFREKYFNFLIDYKKSKGALLIATHSLEIVNRLCDKVLFLDKGRQIAFGPTKEVLEVYKEYKF
ncbi:MAG: ABC transporter ATP-binding protein [Candidatus Omnitrophica bacterium]|jgi:ABC-type polysaccharide/polyol phosphate transport system ATPase subunit|nr:ABC transporter ATP-binding protein [Candidatus Omnitrophota bacterium]